VGETHTMEILQTLGCPVQLLLYFSGGGSGDIGATYQIKSVGVITFYVLHDVPVLHPL